MATSLFAITNSKPLSLKKDKALYKPLLKKLKTYYKDELNEPNDFYSYTIKFEDEEEPFHIHFDYPFGLSPYIYKNIGLIFTPYKYDLIYSNDEIYFFQNFRKELFNIISMIGGTEVIFLADNSCDKVSSYYYDVISREVSYEEIKSKMIKQMGNPITDYSKMPQLKSYRNINEFFIDDFSDLKG